MNVTRFAAAPPYPAPPDHHGMTCLRLQERNEARALENRSDAPVAVPLPPA